MRKVIRLERRESGPGIGMAGVWSPVLIVWPQYDGRAKDDYEATIGSLDHEIENAWGHIMAEAFAAFCRLDGVNVYTFQRTPPSLLSRLLGRRSDPWSLALKPYQGLEEEALNIRQHVGHDVLVHLLAGPLEPHRVRAICESETLDRTTLLPHGCAMVEMGIEEAVTSVAFDDEAAEARFVDALAATAARHGHRLERAEQPFVSHWLTVRQG